MREKWDKDYFSPFILRQILPTDLTLNLKKIKIKKITLN